MACVDPVDPTPPHVDPAARETSVVRGVGRCPAGLPEQVKDGRKTTAIHALMAFEPRDEIEGMRAGIVPAIPPGLVIAVVAVAVEGGGNCPTGAEAGASAVRRLRSGECGVSKREPGQQWVRRQRRAGSGGTSCQGQACLRVCTRINPLLRLGLGDEPP